MSCYEYLNNLSRTLMAFQFLELLLKFYILDCERIIQKSVKDSFHYSVREKNIEKMPLGRLTEEFSKRSNKKDIVSKLKKLNKQRNQIAHNGYLLTVEDQGDSEKMRKFSETVTQIRKAVDICMKDIMHEHSKVTNKLISEETKAIFDQS